ncbi:GNAT family N-acetyltransferase [Shouchella patagoniensis]|uniref:GNAT family N-acetyltransferase n=1 Tax=Shouchella patagoniensis TaxID=228576 RepID=UPI0014728BCB|nr:GNAT family N-acetyltransferase [Shouchella patagoniensis]
MKEKIIELQTNDISSIVALSETVGWDYDKREVRTVLEVGTVYVIKNGDYVIASAALIPYANTGLASIGMVIVAPAYRGQGLGRMVTQACINKADNKFTLLLVATEDGKKLYEKMDFVEWGEVHKYVRSETEYQRETNLDDHEYKWRPYQKEDFNQLVQLDEQAFGANRRRLIIQRLNQCKKCTVLIDERECITAYGMAIETPANTIIGPLVAPDSEKAKKLINLLLRGNQGNIRIDMPKQDDLISTYLIDQGFKLSAQPPIMVRGNKAGIKRNGQLYALAAQIFG